MTENHGGKRWFPSRIRLEDNGKQRTYRLGATRGRAKATTLRSTMMAAIALAAYFWYTSIMYPITQSISRTVPPPYMAAPMLLRLRISPRINSCSKGDPEWNFSSAVNELRRKFHFTGYYSRHDPVYTESRTPSVPEKPHGYYTSPSDEDWKTKLWMTHPIILFT